MPLPPPAPRASLPESTLKAAQQILRELSSDSDLPTDLEMTDSVGEDSTGGLKESRLLQRPSSMTSPGQQSKAAWQQVTDILQFQRYFSGKTEKWIQRRFQDLVAYCKENTKKQAQSGGGGVVMSKKWKKIKFNLTESNVICIAALLEKVQSLREQMQQTREEELASKKKAVEQARITGELMMHVSANTMVPTAPLQSDLSRSFGCEGDTDGPQQFSFTLGVDAEHARKVPRRPTHTDCRSSIHATPGGAIRKPAKPRFTGKRTIWIDEGSPMVQHSTRVTAAPENVVLLAKFREVFADFTREQNTCNQMQAEKVIGLLQRISDGIDRLGEQCRKVVEAVEDMRSRMETFRKQND